VDWVLPPDLDFYLREELRQDGSSEALMTMPLSFGGVRAWVFHPDVRVDLVSRNDGQGALYEAALKSAQKTARVRMKGLLAPVVDLEFLVALKTAAWRPKDQADAIALLYLAPVARPRLRRILEKYKVPDWEERLRWMETEAAREKIERRGKD
jgi:hypothetical protein